MIKLSNILKLLLRVGAFFRLLDENGDLSITNIFAIIVLVKVCINPTLDTSDLIALLTVISTYQFKRYIQRTKDKDC